AESRHGFAPILPAEIGPPLHAGDFFAVFHKPRTPRARNHVVIEDLKPGHVAITSHRSYTIDWHGVATAAGRSERWQPSLNRVSDAGLPYNDAAHGDKHLKKLATAGIAVCSILGLFLSLCPARAQSKDDASKDKHDSEKPASLAP